MTITIREAAVEDVPDLSGLLDDYMQETFNCPWYGSPDALATDGFGEKFELILAESSLGKAVGFCAWQPSYDLHHCITGAEIIDVYVAPAFRGHAVPLLLTVALASRVRERGGCFVKGQAVMRAGVKELYERVAMVFPGADCIVGGRAFRALADLAGRPARVVVRNLPDRSWNDQT